MTSAAAETENSAKRIQIYRAGDAPLLTSDRVEDNTTAPGIADRFAELGRAGFGEGHQIKRVFSAPGFTLTYVWFKSGFPLPRHTHNADCLYYIIAGELTFGTETLRANDGFFVPADVAYTYTPGPAGVEVLEFRATNRFDIRFLAASPSFWSRALETISAERAGWATQPRPQDLPGPRAG